MLCAPDKFRGTLSAGEAAAAIAAGARRAGWAAIELPLSDGGDGLLEVVGGERRRQTVTGPDGRPLQAEWRLLRSGAGGDGGGPTAVIEMARASGLEVAGGFARNDPLGATTAGTGELVAAAVRAGAERVVVGCGGSATTDGGAGALEAISRLLGAGGLDSVELLAATDVTTTFGEAAAVFAPQKGATPAQVELLAQRLAGLARRYRHEHGIDVGSLPGSGAAGGLAGGLAAVGGRIVSGLELVAQLVGLDAALDRADAVVTGEGCLDVTSFAGKVVGGVYEHWRRHPGRRGEPDPAPLLGAVGAVLAPEPAASEHPGLVVVSLSEQFGRESALAAPARLLAEVVTGWLGGGPALQEQV